MTTESTLKTVFNPGETISIETGEYSDYSSSDPFVVLKTLDIKEQLGIWLVANPEATEDYSFNYWEFVAWLSSQGFIADKENHQRVWLGAYSCLPEWAEAPAFKPKGE